MQDIGLLVLRLMFGCSMLFAHGFGKMERFSTAAASFPDPLGVGSTASLSLAIFAEVLCSLLVAVGFMGRLACLPLVITMTVAAAVVHGADPWAKKELAVMYGVTFLALALTGPGRFSIDQVLQQRRLSKAVFRP